LFSLFFEGALSMTKLMNCVRNLRSREEGATMIEYGLLAALVSVAALAALLALGPALLGIFNTVVAALTGA
jgi:pilus assembly protein Flp/PilA